MVGGLMNKLSSEVLASSTTIAPTSEVVKLTGSTAIATITPPPNGGFDCMLVLIPIDGTLGLLTTGNIAIAVTMAQKRATVVVWDEVNAIWYPGAIS